MRAICCAEKGHERRNIGPTNEKTEDRASYVDGDVDSLDALLAQHEQEHLAERRADDRVDQLVERDDVDRQPEQLHTINGATTQEKYMQQALA